MSTLMRLLAGLEQADSGSVAVPEDLAYLGQEAASAPGASIGDVLGKALSTPRGAVDRLETLALHLDESRARDEYAVLLEWAELHDAWNAEHRVKTAAAGLGLGALPWDRDLLLLDEPTNHISLALADELEEALRRSPGTVVVASYDRWLRRRWEGQVLAP